MREKFYLAALGRLGRRPAVHKNLETNALDVRYQKVVASFRNPSPEGVYHDADLF